MSEVPRFTDGTTYADQAWWNETPETRWPGNRADPSEWTREDHVWARCWAYIDEKGVPASHCGIVWAIAYAAIDAMTVEGADA